MRKVLTFAFIAVFAALGAAGVATARSGDRDRDKLPDKWEKQFRLSTKQKSARLDNDRDGLNNLGEFESGNNPRDDDTDGDGRRDGDENAGVIESFDAATGRLVITLAPNGSITGKVDESTEIECEDRIGRSSSSGPGSDGDRDDADNSGPGNADDGDRRDDDDRGDDRDDCTTAALVNGAKVDEAELRGNGVFEKVEIDS